MLTDYPVNVGHCRFLPLVTLFQSCFQKWPDSLFLTFGWRTWHLCGYRLRVRVRRATRLGSASLGHHAVTVPVSWTRGWRRRAREPLLTGNVLPLRSAQSGGELRLRTSTRGAQTPKTAPLCFYNINMLSTSLHVGNACMFKCLSKMQ